MTRSDLLARFKELKVVVVGDLMVDEYIFGHVDRISPEAPVMVVRQERTTRLPGGAANVAVNLLAYGAKVDVVGVVGPDGDLLREALRAQGMDTQHLVTDSERLTTRKTRVIADHRQQVLRIDHEETSPLRQETEFKLLQTAKNCLRTADVIVFSDYRKGCLTESTAAALVAQAREQGATAVANPKPGSAHWYRGIDLVSLNRAEASAVLGAPVSRESGATDTEELKASIGAPVLVTLGEEGMMARGPSFVAVDAHSVEVADPAGAGDTVIATVALGLTAAGFERVVFELAAHAAACVVRHVGVAAPNPADLATLGRD